jgi:hypothetical protein
MAKETSTSGIERKPQLVGSVDPEKASYFSGSILQRNINNLANIARVRYTHNDFYGSDVTSLDIPGLYLKAQKKLKISNSPEVLLIVRHRLLAAALGIIFRKIGFVTTVCTDNFLAYERYIVPSPSRYELVLIEWGGMGFTAADLIHFVRSLGSRSCIAAIIGTRQLPGDAIRRGADLFFRAPIVIHLFVLRKLLLPSAMALHGYPISLLRQPAKLSEIAVLLRGPKKDPAELLQELEKDEATIESEAKDPGDGPQAELVNSIIQYFKDHDPTAHDDRWLSLMKSTAESMSAAKQCIVRLTRQLNGHSRQPRGAPTADSSACDDLSHLTRPELLAEYFKLQQRLQESEAELRQQEREFQSLRRSDVKVVEILEKIASDGGFFKATATHVSKPITPPETPTLQSTIQDYPEKKSCMKSEDRCTHSNAQRGDPPPLSFYVAWPSRLADANPPVFTAVLKMLESICRLCEENTKKVLRTAPSTYAQLAEFNAAFLDVVNDDPERTFASASPATNIAETKVDVSAVVFCSDSRTVTTRNPLVGPPPTISAIAAAMVSPRSKKALSSLTPLQLHPRKASALQMRVSMTSQSVRFCEILQRRNAVDIVRRYFARWLYGVSPHRLGRLFGAQATRQDPQHAEFSQPKAPSRARESTMDSPSLPKAKHGGPSPRKKAATGSRAAPAPAGGLKK